MEGTNNRRQEATLKVSEQLFRSIVETSLAGIFVTDNNFRFSYVNNMVCEFFGYRDDELLGQDFRMLLDEGSKQMVVERYLRRQRGEKVPGRYEFDIIRKDGQKRRMELSSTVAFDLRGIPKTVGQLLDVTERVDAEAAIRRSQEELEKRVEERTADLLAVNVLLKKEVAQREQAEQALRQSETKYRHLIETADAIILEIDTEGRVVFINRFAQSFFGFNEAEILGKNVVGTLLPEVDSAGRDLRPLADDVVKHPERYPHNEAESILRSGERVWIVWTNLPVYDESGKLKEMLSVGIDRTKDKKAEDKLAQQAREKTAIEERSRIARDLHDAVSQTLFSSSLIAEVLPGIWDNDPAEGRKRLEDVRQLTKGALAEMRTLLFELRPSALADAELGALLRQLGESITGGARVPVTMEISGQCETPGEVKVAIYRITQEALNNVAKHAMATQAWLKLQRSKSGIELEVADNGRGFDERKVRPDNLGLGIMRERADSIGASLVVTSDLGRGTRIQVRWSKSPQRKDRGPTR